MRYHEIIDEASVDKLWKRSDIAAISVMAQERFDSLKSGFSLLGDIDTHGGVFDVWGAITDDVIARFYACEGDINVGYLTFYTLKLPDPMMMQVSMVFVLPKYQRSGIATALYRFALSQGIVIVSDGTLTQGSKAIWQAMIDDPRIDVTMIDYDRYDKSQPPEQPLTNIRLAFSQKQRRMVARLKSPL